MKLLENYFKNKEWNKKVYNDSKTVFATDNYDDIPFLLKTLSNMKGTLELDPKKFQRHNVIV